MSTRGDMLVAAVRSKGSDARDVRDAAHEACHALKWKAKKWDRESIHKKRPKVRGFGVSDEILARAVEQLVCADLGVECWPVEKAAMICWMEMLKNERVSLPGGSWLEDRIREAMAGKQARKEADAVLALLPKDEPTAAVRGGKDAK